MTIRSVWWTRIAIVGGILLAGYLLVGRAFAPKDVDVVEMSAAPAEQILAVVGRVRPANLVRVQSETAGAVVEMLRDEGDRVRKGDLLARIRADQVVAAEAVFEAQIRALDAELNLARQKRTRISRLATEGWATKTALDEAEAMVAAALANRDAASATVRQSRARTREFEVRAPMDGTILTRPVDPGQVVGLSTVLFEMGSNGRIEIEAEVDEFLADRVPASASVILSPSGTSLRLPGRISEVSPQIDASTGGRLMRFVPSTPAGEFRPGRSVDVVMTVARFARTLSVPRSAVLNNRGRTEVRVVEQGRVATRTIATLDWPGAALIVTGGLKIGDLVLIEPSKTAVGSRVKANPLSPTEPVGTTRQ